MRVIKDKVIITLAFLQLVYQVVSTVQRLVKEVFHMKQNFIHCDLEKVYEFICGGSRKYGGWREYGEDNLLGKVFFHLNEYDKQAR